MSFDLWIAMENQQGDHKSQFRIRQLILFCRPAGFIAGSSGKCRERPVVQRGSALAAQAKPCWIAFTITGRNRRSLRH